MLQFEPFPLLAGSLARISIAGIYEVLCRSSRRRARKGCVSGIPSQSRSVCLLLSFDLDPQFYICVVLLADQFMTLPDI